MSLVIFDSAYRDWVGDACFGSGHGGWVGFSIFKNNGATAMLNSINTLNDADNLITVSSDMLIYWPAGTVSIIWNDNGDNSSNSNNELTISAPSRTASATGTASEFLYFGGAGNNGTYSCVAIAGTVSSTGGGGDVVIADTNIISGQAYRLQNLRFDFFKDFTY